MFYWISLAVLVALGIPTLGGMAYFGLAIFSTVTFRRRTAARVPAATLPPMSLLKPLCGAESELEGCLKSFFEQDYPAFELLFAVRTPDDPAVEVVNRLIERHPDVPARLLLTGQPPYANAKVFSMRTMAEAAKHDIFIITDSDTLVAPDYLRAMAAAFADEKVGAVTNLYRGAEGTDFWAKLEALGMSTEFMAGVVVAERLEGMKFALGPSMAIRRACLADIGGFEAMKDFLADDFVLGHWADRAGWSVGLSPFVVDHLATTAGFGPTFAHRLRWNRSSRFSRPDGYIGQGFTYGLVWAMFFALAAPPLIGLPALAASLTLRIVLALTLGAGLLGDRTVPFRLWMLPIQDLTSWATWVGGFLGKTVLWRGERYQLLAEGRFAPLSRNAE